MVFPLHELLALLQPPAGLGTFHVAQDTTLSTSALILARTASTEPGRDKGVSGVVAEVLVDERSLVMYQNVSQ